MSGFDREESRNIVERLDQLEARVSELESVLLKTKSRRTLLKSKGSPLGATMKLYDEGYFKTPREFPEIKQELARQGYYYPSAPLYVALTRDIMKNRGLLTRIGKKREWKYVERK